MKSRGFDFIDSGKEREGDCINIKEFCERNTIRNYAMYIMEHGGVIEDMNGNVVHHGSLCRVKSDGVEKVMALRWNDELYQFEFTNGEDYDMVHPDECYFWKVSDDELFYETCPHCDSESEGVTAEVVKNKGVFRCSHCGAKQHACSLCDCERCGTCTLEEPNFRRPCEKRRDYRDTDELISDYRNRFNDNSPVPQIWLMLKDKKYLYQITGFTSNMITLNGFPTSLSGLNENYTFHDGSEMGIIEDE